MKEMAYKCWDKNKTIIIMKEESFHVFKISENEE